MQQHQAFRPTARVARPSHNMPGNAGAFLQRLLGNTQQQAQRQPVNS